MHPRSEKGRDRKHLSRHIPAHPEALGKALVLEGLRQAHKQKRRCFLYAFSGRGELKAPPLFSKRWFDKGFVGFLWTHTVCRAWPETPHRSPCRRDSCIFPSKELELDLSTQDLGES